jgi:alpha-L-fucosidase 2
MGYLEDCDIISDRPGSDPSQRMLLGNGDAWVLAWVDGSGEVVLEPNKSDAWDEIGGPAKMGQIRIAIQPNPFVPGMPFRQRLHLHEGACTIVAGGLIDGVELRLWVDAGRPVVRVEIHSKAPIAIRATVGGSGRRSPFAKDNSVFWFHRNNSSVWPATLHLQSMEEWAAGDIDPLLYRTCGAAMEGEGMRAMNGGTMESMSPANRISLMIHLLVRRAVEEEDWVRELSRQIEQTKKTTIEQLRSEHQAWWRAFWNRSYIRVTGDAAAEAVTNAYARQRYHNACGRPSTDPDGAFRFPFARLHYWPMLACGDANEMRSMFRMYLDALPMSLHRTRRYFDHPGVFFPAKMHVWGSYLNSDYGIAREGLAVGQVRDRAIRYDWTGGLELLAMLLEHELYVFTEDFAQSTLLPVADAIVTFYDRHYRRVNGKIRFEPAQALDVWHEAVDPLPEIAGLRFVLEGLLRLPAELISSERQSQWERLASELPPTPMRRGLDELGANYLIPAVQYDDLKAGRNPELAAVFPYRGYGVGKPDLAIARRTFERREFKGQATLDAIQAALLGLVDEAQSQLVRGFHSCGMLALQYMLLQCDHERILVLPAWPNGWDVEWKLHAPMRTTVEGIVRGGELRKLIITPEVREKDAILAK